MRTTVTLDAELVQKLKALALRTGTSFKQTLNDVIRRGLSAQEPRGARRPRFVVKPHAGGFRPGIDPGKLNQLLDQLDAEEFADEARR